MSRRTDEPRFAIGGRRARAVTRRALLGQIGAAGAALAWGAPDYARAAAPGGGTLTYGMSLDVDETLDPQVTNWISVVRVVFNICETLVLQPVMGRFVPGLAESWQVSPDAKTFTFKLKRGVVFHDGTPFTAEAVRFTLDRVVDPATKAGASHDALGPYDQTEVVDDYTARIVMKQGFAPLLGNLATGVLGIVSPDAVKKMGPAAFAQHPVGTGPFMFKEWVAQDHITVVRNPAYRWGSSYYKHTGPAYLDQIIYKVILEPAVRTGTLKSGETQFIDDVDPQQYDVLRHDSQLVVIDQGQTGSGETILLNTSTGPTADPQVRVAIEYAIDRDGLNQSVYHGTNKVAWSPLMRPTFAYDANTEKMYSYSPDKARATLEAAGWKIGSGGVREKNGEK
ncbi:MAG TPA: ABC transporter substrate-binding protein, partial [bacterium]|nr:ABC transporter substrate-binding protein [bacterium]